MQLVKKSFVFTFISMISLSTLIIMPQQSSANEEMPEDPIVLENISQDQSSEIDPYFINDFRFSKENVSFSESWSPYKRVSENITTGKAGGSISATKTESFTVQITGPVNGIDVSTGKTLSSSVGYTLNADPNKSVYMGFRVKYKVESGTHVTTDIATGKVTKKAYTVKVPMFGDYKLINY